MFGRVRSDKVGSGQIRSVQSKSDQLRSGQVRSKTGLDKALALDLWSCFIKVLEMLLSQELELIWRSYGKKKLEMSEFENIVNCLIEGSIV